MMNGRIFRSLAAAALSLVLSFPAIAAREAVILHTGDVHCAMEGYPALAAFRQDLIDAGIDVAVVDAGDAIQGDAVGAITKGGALVDLMNAVPYDIAVPGNHEFGYGLQNLFDLAKKLMKHSMISANFIDLKTGKPVFSPCKILELGGRKVAFIGVTTPQTYSSSSPKRFMDDKGNFLYSFCEDRLADVVQRSVDEARAAGAEKVVLVTHLGVNGITEGWRSVDMIARTRGVDAVIDGHSHEVFVGETAKNLDGADVPYSAAGAKMIYFGKLTLSADGTFSSEMVSPLKVTARGEKAAAARDRVQRVVDQNVQRTAYLTEPLGMTEVTLATHDPATGERLCRSGETNLGDFCADAYRTVLKSDIAVVNGGGIRSFLPQGDVCRKAVLDVFPFGASVCVIEVTGQTLLDALEYGVSSWPEERGGFLHVSGMEYVFDPAVPSPILTDSRGAFAEVAPGRPRRITELRIQGKPVDPQARYSLAGSRYVLREGGDGYSLFRPCRELSSGKLPSDFDILWTYFSETLKGRVTKEQYGNPYGSGRITILKKQ